MEDAEEEGIDLSQIQFIGGDYVKIIFEEEKAVSKALSLTQFQINKLKFTLDLRNAENATLPRLFLYFISSPFFFTYLFP